METTENKKSSLKKVLLVAGLAVAAVFIFIIFVAGSIINAATGPQKAAKAFMEEAVNGSVDQAYLMTSVDFKATATAEDLAVFLENYPIQPSSMTFTSFSIENNIATISGKVLVAGQQSPITFTMVKSGGEWQVLNFSLNPDDVPDTTSN